MGGGRNFYYTGRFQGESDIDVIERLALVNERDALAKELEAVTRQLLWVSAELDAYKSFLQNKRVKEFKND